MVRFALLAVLALLLTACSSPPAPDAGEGGEAMPSDPVERTEAVDEVSDAPTTMDTADESSPPDMHTSRNALDWPGTYEGVLPCADCDGILTTLTLAANGRYVLSRAWLGEGDAVLTEEGAFTWTDDGRNVVLEDQDPGGYKVGENRLWVLDQGMERIEGDLADRYVLDKVMEP